MKPRWIDRTPIHGYRTWALCLLRGNKRQARQALEVRIVQQNVLEEFDELPGWDCTIYVDRVVMAKKELHVAYESSAKTLAESFVRRTIGDLSKGLANLPKTKRKR